MALEDQLTIVVLAAGRGTRMRNHLPKVLHPLAGRSLIGHVTSIAPELGAACIVVLAPGMDDVQAEVQKWCPSAQFAMQKEALGTGHAVASALPLMPKTGTIAVLFGDTPLITAATVQQLQQSRQRLDAAVVAVGMHPPDPHGYGRLEFDQDGHLAAIIEHVHASAELRASALCNSGIMAIDAAKLGRLIDMVPRQSSNGEYYLTDIVEAAVSLGWTCGAIEADHRQGHGVNSQAQLAQANSHMQERLRQELLDSGVIMPAPETVQLAYDTRIAPGALIEPFTVFGPGVEIGPDASIRSFSHLEGAAVHKGAVIGPYARLRPGSVIGESARIGNFVETKNALFGKGAKANHLSYLGDCSAGAGSNIGAGTITCNYDGFNKHQTEIGDDVFVGSNTALVAPLSIGHGAVIGAGSTITANVAADELALTRPKRTSIKTGASRIRERLARKKQEKHS